MLRECEQSKGSIVDRTHLVLVSGNLVLQKTLASQEMSPRLMESGNGLIELGLCFSRISSQLKISVMSAEKLKAVNFLGGLSGHLSLSAASDLTP